MTTAPRIGITVAYDDGRHEASFRPGTVTHFAGDPYIRAVEKAGGVPLLLPVTASEIAINGFLEVVDGIILSGGGGVAARRYVRTGDLPGLRDLSPERYDFETMLARRALTRDMPVVGICRGHQVLAEAGGGSLYTRIEEQVPGAREHLVREAPVGLRPVHGLHVEPGTLLHYVVGTEMVGVNSLHRQSVAEVPDPFIVSGRAEDGVVEAIESRAHRFVLGVQFHPELMVEEPVWDRLFRAFVEACRPGPTVRSA